MADEISMFPTDDFNEAKLQSSTKDLVNKLKDVGFKVKITPAKEREGYTHGVYIELAGTIEHGWINDELTLQGQLNYYYDNRERYLSEELKKQ